MNINDVALRRLGTRNRTVSEMEKYLAGKGFEEAEIIQVIEDFKEYGYLDDFRYCLEFFDYGFGKGWSKRKLFNELAKKGVDRETVSGAFDEYDKDTDEYHRAKKEAEKILKMADVPDDEPVPQKVIGRIARRLAGYGYASDVIYSIIGDLKNYGEN